MGRKKLACRRAWGLMGSLVLSGVTAASGQAQGPDGAPGLLPPPPAAPVVVQAPAPPAAAEPVEPPLLNRPLETPPSQDPAAPVPAPVPEGTAPQALVQYEQPPPLGFTGPSGILPIEGQESSHFVPVVDRWRLGFPEWDRYGKGYTPHHDFQWELGRWYNPYNQNVLKGDYPILGQHTFLDITATSLQLFEVRQIPTATTPFESTSHPFQDPFFGRPNQFFYTHYAKLSFDLFHGDAAFKPADWRIKLTPVSNFNSLNVDELAVVSPDVRRGTTRHRTFTTLEEWFVESKIADLSVDYDFVSARAGSQFFISDFRGFMFADTNRAVRLFGTRNANRDQFNVIWFDQMEKNTNSGLNDLDRDRHQNIVIANYYRQDFIWPGYTVTANLHYNRDQPSFLFDQNGFLVRPDPVGVFQPHEVEVVYLGFGGDGHIGRYNLTHMAYWAIGHDSLNPIAGRDQNINAQFFAGEISYDRDWMRFRTSYLFASGDGNPRNSHATGFDTILDNPNFAGGQFSYWQRQGIPLFGVALVNRNSLVPDLRASKAQGQSNFVNPGLHLLNFGVDAEITPKFRMINNLNLLFFDKTAVLQQYLFTGKVDRFIGTDISSGFEYRPLLSNNVIMTFGAAALFPGEGFEDLYSNLRSNPKAMLQGFLEVVLTY